MSGTCQMVGNLARFPDVSEFGFCLGLVVACSVPDEQYWWCANPSCHRRVVVLKAWKWLRCCKVRNVDRTLVAIYVVLMSTDSLKYPVCVAEHELACAVWPANAYVLQPSFLNCGA